MTNLEPVIQAARAAALAEIEKYKVPTLSQLELSYEKGVSIAGLLAADNDVVKIGTLLMDIKLGEAFSNNKLADHVAMSVAATKVFLKPFNLPAETVVKIINCVEGHHKAVPWECVEAEICANADCYRFLKVRDWLTFLFSLQARNNFTEALKYAKTKFEEKLAILSLDICRTELAPDIAAIKEIIKLAEAG